jgi:hypothetical protein
LGRQPEFGSKLRSKAIAAAILIGDLLVIAALWVSLN